MTLAEKKAKEIIDKFHDPCDVGREKQARALICVDEILKNPLTSYPESMGIIKYSRNYWIEVKKYLENYE